MNWDNLPGEICTDILTRLPTKTLICCTVLSKFFHTFIINPNFITTHLKKTSNNHQLLLRYVPEKTHDSEFKEVFIIEPDNEDNFTGFKNNQGLVLPFEDHLEMWCNVLGSINGVICLSTDVMGERTVYVMWNPCINKLFRLPRPGYVYETCCFYESASGFGFDSLTDDYKVVRLVYLDVDDDDDDGGDWRVPLVEVYSLRSGCWRPLGKGLDYLIRRGGPYTACFVNGCVHWIGHSVREGLVVNVVLKFNVSSESFGVIELPSCLKHLDVSIGSVSNLVVQECRGTLALVGRQYDGNPRSCGIWLLKEYGVVDSWVKIVDVDMPSEEGCLTPAAFGFRNNGKVIVAKCDYEPVYSRRTKTCLVVSIDQKHGEAVIGKHDVEEATSLYLSTYQESLVLFEVGRERCAIPEEMKRRISPSALLETSRYN